MMKKVILANLNQNCFATMITYWVPDLPNIKAISGQLGHLQCAIFRFAKQIKLAKDKFGINKPKYFSPKANKMAWPCSAYSIQIAQE